MLEVNVGKLGFFFRSNNPVLRAAMADKQVRVFSPKMQSLHQPPTKESCHVVWYASLSRAKQMVHKTLWHSTLFKDVLEDNRL